MSAQRLTHTAKQIVAAARSVRNRSATRTFSAATRTLESAAAFDGLHPRSLAVASIRPVRRQRTINVVLPQLSLSTMFAGVKTALEIAIDLAARLDCPLRLVALTGRLSSKERKAIAEFLLHEYGERANVVADVLESVELPRTSIGTRDLWIATHWTTAHSLDVAGRLGVVDVRDVIYLIQDYEPGFVPWSTEFALARATYHAGFHTIVNSAPLAAYLATQESLTISRNAIFRPQLDLSRLERTATARKGHTRSVPSLLFYARPDKPRNMFTLGMSAIALALLDEGKAGQQVTVRTAGALHPMPKDGPLFAVDRLGKLSWADYFVALCEADIVLSLQHSPHPSHPPLDAVVSGGWAVTNEMGGTRGSLDQRLHAPEPDPREVASAIRQCIDEVRGGTGPAGYRPEVIEGLGEPLDAVLDAVASRFA